MGTAVIKTQAYAFRDDDTTARVDVAVPAGCRVEDFAVRSSIDALHVTDQRSGTVLVDVVQLAGQVNAKATRAAVRGSNLQLTLHKLHKGPWSGLEPKQVDCTSAQQPNQTQASGALSERDRVKRLLSASQEDSTEALQAAYAEFGGSDVAQVKDANGMTAMHFAAQQGRLPNLQYLIEELKAMPDPHSEAGDTPLGLAAGAGRAAACGYLLGMGADPNRQQGKQPAPIHRAATSGSVEVVQRLLDGQADCNLASEVGTPLHWAVGSGHTPAAEVLLRHGADANLANPEGVAPILMAAAAGSTQAVRSLLDAGANPNAQAIGGVAPLHAAAEAGSLDCASALLKAGAKPDLRDDLGATPLDVAAAEGDEAMVKLLMPADSPSLAGDLIAKAAKAPRSAGTAAEAPSEAEKASIPDPETPDDAAAEQHKRAGDEAFVRQAFSEAADAYSAALKCRTSSHILWANRAAALLRLKRPAEALEDARRSRTLQPSFVKAWFREGAAAEALQMWEPAAQAYYEAYHLDPTNNQLAAAFQRAIEQGRKAHQASQAAK